VPQRPFDSEFAYNIYTARYRHPEDRDWEGTSKRVVTSVYNALMPGAQHYEDTYDLMAARKFIPGGRYLYAAGRDLHQVNNCLLMRAEDSREGWAELSYNAEMALMTGAGIGVWYGDLRPAGAPIRRTGGEASGPMGKMMMVNDMGRYVMQGGARRSAIWAGLPWDHPDVLAFIVSKDWPDWLREKKEEDWTIPAPMDCTNISVTLDDRFFEAYGNPSDPDHDLAQNVYWTSLRHMLRHGEPGFTVDTCANAGEVLRNACTEITSADDSDVCNLGSLVLSRFDNPNEFGEAVRQAVAFLTAGSVYSHVPYAKVAEVRERNRRLGLGLIGVHEFLMLHGVKYGTPEAFEVLEPYMAEYARALEYAHEFQDAHGLSLSKGATAIAPNGTIGIIAESTPSADPMLTAAERRNVKIANVHGPDRYEQHVVVDPVARKMRTLGVPSSLIEDAYTLSLAPERRLAQQVFLQSYTDHAISSTINLPHVMEGREAMQMGEELMKHLPKLRGITFYPDGARAGQPRTPVDLDWALANEGTVFASDEETCVGGVCGV
jgi:ribonucleoside-diphosphate reductase alpha chain